MTYPDTGTDSPDIASPYCHCHYNHPCLVVAYDEGTDIHDLLPFAIGAVEWVVDVARRATVADQFP